MKSPETAWGSSLEGSAVVEQVPGMIKNLNISTFGIWLVGMYIWARKCTCWNGQMSIENKNDGICEIWTCWDGHRCPLAGSQGSPNIIL